MPVRVITWNLYHGTIGAQTPSERLQQIAQIAAANAVDIVCLQEVPQALLENGFNGEPLNNPGVIQALNAPLMNNFLNDFTVVQYFSENSQQNPLATHTADGYLFLFRDATIPHWGNLQQFHPAQFSSPYGTFYRPPVSLSFYKANGAQGRLMNWHCETGPGAGICVDALNHMLGNAHNLAHRNIIAGDLNVRGSVDNVSIGNSWANWYDVIARYPVGNNGVEIWGLDHILASGHARPRLGTTLDFRSDAYHFPLCADIS